MYMYLVERVKSTDSHYGFPEGLFAILVLIWNEFFS
jgi:hypothetical protein